MSGLTKEQIARLLGPAKVAVPEVVSPKLVAKKRGGVLLHQPLPKSVVLDIRKRFALGETLKSIAETHGITKAAVSLIGSGQRHKDA